MELESKVTQLQEEVDKGGGGAAKKQNGENIPRPPCKYTLSGHRNNINSIRYDSAHLLTTHTIATHTRDVTCNAVDKRLDELMRAMCIQRHRFHPLFNILASASEDATIMLWDYETGEFDRTLKGHTLAVQDIAFDQAGKFLGTRPPCSHQLSLHSLLCYRRAPR
jgi:platelet-activating factor acetylhydrolase IB subunit alpha